MTEPERPDEGTGRPKLSPGRLQALSWFARLEFAVAGILAIALCIGRLTWFHENAEPLWAAMGVIILPGYTMAAVLTFVHARQIGRPSNTVWPELAFWAVAPVAAAVLLAVTGLLVV